MVLTPYSKQSICWQRSGKTVYGMPVRRIRAIRRRSIGSGGMMGTR